MYSQLLFDPPKEEFDLPTHEVEHGYHFGCDLVQLAEVDVDLSVLRVAVSNASKRPWVRLFAGRSSQQHGLVTAQSRLRIHRFRSLAVVHRVAFCLDHEECTHLVNAGQPGKIEISPVD